MRKRFIEIAAGVLLLAVVIWVGATFARYQRLNDALSLALDRQQVAVVKSLIRRGASPDTRSPRGNTALIWAAVWPDEPFARELLDRHVDVNAQNQNGATALMGAAGWGHAGMVRLLLARGANPDLRDRRDQTALKQAQALLGHPPTNRWAGADARYAATRKRVEEVSRLLQHAGTGP